jgi:hypothetical protein
VSTDRYAEQKALAQERREALAQKRARALELLAEGLPAGVVAKRLGVTRHSVNTWKRSAGDA